MKTMYEVPRLDVYFFSVEDVIATSVLEAETEWTPGNGSGDINWGDIWY